MATKSYAEWHAIFDAHDVWHAPVNRFEEMLDDKQVCRPRARTLSPLA